MWFDAALPHVLYTLRVATPGVRASLISRGRRRRHYRLGLVGAASPRLASGREKVEVIESNNLRKDNPYMQGRKE